jgi:hypothetical protein
MANSLAILIDKSVSFIKSFQWLDINKVPIDIAFHTFKAQLRKNTDDDSTLYAEFAITVTDAALGKFDLELTAEQTAAIPTRPQVGSEKILTEYSYDVKIIYPNLKSKKIIEGKALISPSATQI